jgi:hypothetical protein
VTGVLDRLMRASVSMALKVQPRRAFRQADHTLYSSPVSRESLQLLRSAGRRLVGGGIAVNGMTAIGWRRSENRIGVTADGADLLDLGPESLTSVSVAGLDEVTGPAAEVVRAVREGAAAAVWAHPPRLLAMAAGGRVPSRVVGELADRAGTIGLGDHGVRFDVTVFPGAGVLAIGTDAADAAIRLEVAERLASVERGVNP